MTDFEFDRDAYLQRVNYEKDISITLECLRGLHYAQLFTMPFENFDIVLGKGISLEPAHLFNKLVNNQRGGYCFELNGLFHMALKSFGFEVRPLLGRVHSSGTLSGKGHQITLITLDGQKWISDVGFGNGTMQGPLPLVLDQETPIFHQTFRLIETELYGILLQLRVEDEWQDQYSFRLHHVFPNDIAYGNHYTSTSSGSFFTRGRVAALPTSEGTNTLLDYTLKRYEGGQLRVEQLEEDEHYIETLYEVFGIRLDASIVDLKQPQGRIS